jgi:hypothetical protein
LALQALGIIPSKKELIKHPKHTIEKEWKMKLSMLLMMLLLSCCLILPTNSEAAAGEKLTVDGYEFDISADYMRGGLTVRGRVGGGKPCQKLNASIYLMDEQGHKAHFDVSLNNYSTSQKFSMEKNIYKGGGRWGISNIYVNCYK